MHDVTRRACQGRQPGLRVYVTTVVVSSAITTSRPLGGLRDHCCSLYCFLFRLHLFTVYPLSDCIEVFHRL